MNRCVFTIDPTDDSLARCRGCGRTIGRSSAGEELAALLAAACAAPADLDAAPASDAAAAIPDAFDDRPCVHRGDVLRRELCQLCGPEKGLEVEIRACGLHGECARRKWKAGSHRQSDGRPVAFCLTCDDQSPPDGG